VRRYRSYVAFTVLEAAVLAALLGYGHRVARLDESQSLPEKRRLVERLQLTDLALWTEARYTRHPSQADFFSPFQDFPSSFDHFPAGSIIAPARRSASAADDELRSP
jgi:hypothetical protein